MPFLVAVVLVVAVHMLTAIDAWTGVGLLADDHQMVGGAILRHRGDWTLASAFFPTPVADAGVALYRPFIDLLFWLEQPLFGIDACGYHVVNSGMHCGTALLWFLLVRRWTGSLLAALAGALLFVGWPGHSEATHWIAARVNVQSTFLLSLALLLHDAGLRQVAASRWWRLGAAAALAMVAIGSKESAVFVVPLAALVSCSAVSWRQRITTMLPMLVATFAWLAWRAHCLGTWGSGVHYGWKAHRVGAKTCADWLQVLLAPAHDGYMPIGVSWAMIVAHTAMLVVAMASWRRAGARLAAAVAATLLLLGYIAGVGLESMHLPSLENVRYTYEPALGLCVLLGLGVAALPRRAQWPTLLILVGLHAVGLDANRQSWLRVAAVYARTHSDVLDIARATQQPLRVIDAPGVHDGAFGYLNGVTEFYFWSQTAPPGTNLRGMVSSTQEWPAVLKELAALAANPTTAPGPKPFVVQWHDGALTPLTMQGQWPQQPWPGVTIAYARIARERPFVGTQLPVQVLVQTSQELRMRVAVNDGSRSWLGEVTQIAPGAMAMPHQVTVWLPSSLAVDVPITLGLVLEQGGQTATLPLGVAVPAAR